MDWLFDLSFPQVFFSGIGLYIIWIGWKFTRQFIFVRKKGIRVTGKVISATAHPSSKHREELLIEFKNSEGIAFTLKWNRKRRTSEASLRSPVGDEFPVVYVPGEESNAFICDRKSLLVLAAFYFFGGAILFFALQSYVSIPFEKIAIAMMGLLALLSLPFFVFFSMRQTWRLLRRGIFTTGTVIGVRNIADLKGRNHEHLLVEALDFDGEAFQFVGGFGMSPPRKNPPIGKTIRIAYLPEGKESTVIWGLRAYLVPLLIILMTGVAYYAIGGKLLKLF